MHHKKEGQTSKNKKFEMPAAVWCSQCFPELAGVRFGWGAGWVVDSGGRCHAWDYSFLCVFGISDGWFVVPGLGGFKVMAPSPGKKSQYGHLPLHKVKIHYTILHWEALG